MRQTEIDMSVPLAPGTNVSETKIVNKKSGRLQIIRYRSRPNSSINDFKDSILCSAMRKRVTST